MAIIIDIEEENRCKEAKSFCQIDVEKRQTKRQFKQRLRESRKVESRDGTPIIEQDTDNCISIWQSVIVQAIYDLVGDGGGYERIRTRAEALAWFGQPVGQGRQSDFEMVCDMAELDPQKVRKCAKMCRKNGLKMLEGFNFRSLRKNSSTRTGRKT